MTRNPKPHPVPALSVTLLLLLVFSTFFALAGYPLPGHRGIQPSKANGYWRGEYSLQNGTSIPFHFEIKNDPKQGTVLYFINADEHFKSGKLTADHDSLRLSLDPFDNEFVFRLFKDSLSGIIRKTDSKDPGSRVTAKKNIKARFIFPAAIPPPDISGTYQINFSGKNGTTEPSVGLFTQTGAALKATFLKITGDSRYLDGILVQDSFYLSSFIGSQPLYYRGKISPDGKISGEALGPRGSQSFTGTTNEDAALPDPYQLTYLKEGYKKFSFSFPDINGATVSQSDKRFTGKVLIITIGGTWCPNCIDEAAFLSPWYEKNKDRGVEVVSILYERQTDPAYIRKSLGRFKNRFHIAYTLLVGGTADKAVVAASLPSLNSFLSFPTTLFIDRQGNVSKIHTGFTGPATGKYYTAFVKEFNQQVDELLGK